MAFVPASAAAAKRRRMRLAEDEEDMARYTQDDLSNDREFKIVRSESGVFRKSEVLRKLIEEEARAGWVMLEKFDDSRSKLSDVFKTQARVEIDLRGRGLPELPLLVLLGWYLIVLQQQDAAAVAATTAAVVG